MGILGIQAQRSIVQLDGLIRLIALRQDYSEVRQRLNMIPISEQDLMIFLPGGLEVASIERGVGRLQGRINLGG
ncbi:protein of unknown function [Candidatus Methylomirabilis oxygeniifera]|uniref:Uncharacterized protein n=1 Tax=Methylomirabilis oxygeniifera TaxID=671143 RepID=D5MLM3_METO1|nr:protein of unknown function [Candidatus Methylomirabilis oxyfera]